MNHRRTVFECLYAFNIMLNNLRFKTTKKVIILLNITVYNRNTLYPKSDRNSTKSVKWFKRMSGNSKESIKLIYILSL